MNLSEQGLRVVHDALLGAYGRQGWWPARDRFEILVGAVLVQRTTWTSAARAVERLRAEGALTAQAILAHSDLAQAIRTAGPHRIKAERLRSLCRWFVDAGGFSVLDGCDTPSLRRALLAQHGIGPETADVILLYAFERPRFVADAYALRILARYGMIETGSDYEAVRAGIEAAGPDDAVFYNELHALLVAHARRHCHKSAPDCAACPLNRRCARRLL